MAAAWSCLCWPVRCPMRITVMVTNYTEAFTPPTHSSCHVLLCTSCCCDALQACSAYVPGTESQQCVLRRLHTAVIGACAVCDVLLLEDRRRASNSQQSRDCAVHAVLQLTDSQGLDVYSAAWGLSAQKVGWPSAQSVVDCTLGVAHAHAWAFVQGCTGLLGRCERVGRRQGCRRYSSCRGTCVLHVC